MEKNVYALLEGQQQTTDTTIPGTENLTRVSEAMDEVIIAGEIPVLPIVGVDRDTEIVIARVIEVRAIVAVAVRGEASLIWETKAAKS